VGASDNPEWSPPLSPCVILVAALLHTGAINAEVVRFFLWVLNLGVFPAAFSFECFYPFSPPSYKLTFNDANDRNLAFASENLRTGQSMLLPMGFLDFVGQLPFSVH